MIDNEMIARLQEVFSKLASPVRLRVSGSDHSDQADLLSMLDGLGRSSEKVVVESDPDRRSTAPSFSVLSADGREAVRFRGIPGGHEFSSLVLAILHSDGKGKLPDEGLIARIRSLRGPVRLRTYVSLSCENCPEVVQALNLMALLHPDFEHETIDGSVATDEVESLGIQGVPAVIHEGRLLHSGKIALVDLLARLEESFGKDESGEKTVDLGSVDVAVIGGGPAGASAAIYSSRKGLRTAIVAEKFGGQLQETKGIENMISVPYTEGVRLSAQLGDHLGRYPVKLYEHRRVSKIVPGPTNRILFEGGEFLDSKTVIIATGAKWRTLGIPGEKEHIGFGVAFCAHCDGPFYKGKRVAVVGGGNSGVEAAIDLSGIAESVTLFEFNEKLKADDVLVEKLRSLPNATVVVNAKTKEVLGDGKKVVGLAYEDRTTGKGSRLDVDGVFVQIGLLPNSHFVKDLLETTPYGEIVVDPRGRTSVPGIYAAGDVTTVPFKQIVVAMGDGAKVALTAFEDRIREKAAG